MSEILPNRVAKERRVVERVILSAAKDLLSARSSTTAGLAFLSLVAVPLAAQTPPPCPAPWPAHTITHLRGLPQPIQLAVRTKVIDIVDAGQPWDATDVAMHGAHFDRFLFAWQLQDRFVVVTEHGGIAYSNRAYTIPATGLTPQATEFQQSNKDHPTVCEFAREATTTPM